MGSDSRWLWPGKLLLSNSLTGWLNRDDWSSVLLISRQGGCRSCCEPAILVKTGDTDRYLWIEP
jgi:hypothetical protein